MTNSTTAEISYYHNNFYLWFVMFLNTKVLLVQVLLGCGGNILNLIVLMSRAMRSRTNLIFAAMAFADLFFLVLHIPAIMFFTGLMRNHKWYRNGVSQFIAGMCNWFSAVSIWCMMYATIERVQVFRSPFKTSKRSASPRFFANIFVILFGCLLLTLVHFVPPKVRAEYTLSQYLVITHMLLVVVVPLVVSTALNVLLVMALRRNTMPLRMLNDSHVHQSLILQRSRAERKVTLMVIVIISCFIICNTPGAVVFVIRETSQRHGLGTKTELVIQAVCNTLAVCGKVLNFALFCLSSEHFRALLKKRLRSIFRFNHPTRRNTYSTATKTFSVPLNDL